MINQHLFQFEVKNLEGFFQKNSFQNYIPPENQIKLKAFPDELHAKMNSGLIEISDGRLGSENILDNLIVKSDDHGREAYLNEIELRIKHLKEMNFGERYAFQAKS